MKGEPEGIYTMFQKIVSTAIPLKADNVDTDQIYPARYLRVTTKEGLGDMLFHDWRYNEDGTKKHEFILNNPKYSGTILLAGNNFGGGSSREHAVWALKQYGFQAVISSFFGDIFKNNSLNNSFLPIQVTPNFLELLFDEVELNPKTAIEIDIEKQTVSIPDKNLQETFAINPYKKVCIINGYDDVDYLVAMKEKTEEFERKRKHDFSMSF
jgi:3-isopropylmalate/(R)-2-methylmalate dehydratase small subunit